MDHALTFCLALPNDADIEIVDDPAKHLRDVVASLSSTCGEDPPSTANKPNTIACLRVNFHGHSLVSQVRSLQDTLAERELEVAAFKHRTMTLYNGEQRHKANNWNLKTQIRELVAAQEEAADREKKLIDALRAEKNSTQKELDEVKLKYAKLAEEHAAAVKRHDTELDTAKHNIAMAENERSTLQRKVEDLTSQNQELAKAVAHRRGRLEDRDQVRGFSDDDLDTAPDNVTSEHSPPPPVKGTPRHGGLESETLKSSLHHAHRMIQNLKGNIHREKTEKLELKRMLQDARFELDARRSEFGF
jgi:chromosome segregation ATPase